MARALASEEDEALARALQASLSEQGRSRPQPPQQVDPYIRYSFFFLNTYFTSVYPTAMWLQCNRPITGAEGSYKASDG